MDSTKGYTSRWLKIHQRMVNSGLHRRHNLYRGDTARAALYRNGGEIMKKAYLFIETGEVRTMQKGDWYIRQLADAPGSDVFNSTIYEAVGGNQLYPPVTILDRHEIEVPDDADQLQIHPVVKGQRSWNGTYIPIPRPKRKVKKTVYLAVTQGKYGMGYSVLTDGQYTMGGDAKLYPVEIEVETTY